MASENEETQTEINNMDSMEYALYLHLQYNIPEIDLLFLMTKVKQEKDEEFSKFLSQ